MDKTYEDSQKISLGCIYIQVLDMGYRKKMEASLISLMATAVISTAKSGRHPSTGALMLKQVSKLRVGMKLAIGARCHNESPFLSLFHHS